MTLDKGKSATANKLRSLKCWVVQVDGSGLDINLHEVKFIPKLWVNLITINKNTLRMNMISIIKTFKIDLFWLNLIE
jgi:hypothetical protein